MTALTGNKATTLGGVKAKGGGKGNGAKGNGKGGAGQKNGREPSVLDTASRLKMFMGADKAAEEKPVKITCTREGIQGLVERPAFDVVMGVVIMCNALMVGVEQTMEVSGEDTSAFRTVVESLFLSVYIIELGLRFSAYGSSACRDRWVVFDAVLVFLGIFATWILEPVYGDLPSELGPLLLLRTARLLRLAKTARLLRRMPAFWLMIRGLVSFMTTTGLSVLVVVGVMFVFSSLGVELITKHSLKDEDEDFGALVEEHFSNLPLFMLTLVQFLTLDGMSQVYKPLVVKDPWLCLYFLPIIFTISIVLANLLFAVILTGTMDANQAELDDNRSSREQAWAALVSNLKELFVRLDEDKSGTISPQEFYNIRKADQVALCEAMECESIHEIFRMLDKEKSGELSINTFFDGIMEKLMMDGEADFKRMERQIETMHWRLKETLADQMQMHSLLQRVSTELESVRKQLLPEPFGRSTSSSSHQSMACKSVVLNGGPAGGGPLESAVDIKRGTASIRSTISRVEAFRPLGSRIWAENSCESTTASSNGEEHQEPWEKDLTSKLRNILDECLHGAVERKKAQAVEAPPVRRNSKPRAKSLSKTPLPAKAPSVELPPPTTAPTAASSSKALAASESSKVPGSPRPSAAPTTPRSKSTKSLTPRSASRDRHSSSGSSSTNKSSPRDQGGAMTPTSSMQAAASVGAASLATPTPRGAVEESPRAKASAPSIPAPGSSSSPPAAAGSASVSAAGAGSASASKAAAGTGAPKEVPSVPQGRRSPSSPRPSPPASQSPAPRPKKI